MLLVVKDDLLDELIHRVPIQLLNVAVLLKESYKFIIVLPGFL